MKNPFLSGFYPDPSICRKGHDFYVANSSFQWFPGVPIHHSKDLRNWELVGYGLTRITQLNLHRIGDSFGIWAPDITYSDGHFWLIYTIVSRQHEVVCSNTNFLVTAEDPRGPWSEPVYLNSMGYDPSMFHDDDGKKYLIGMLVDDTPGISERFTAIVVQEYDPHQQKLVGPVRRVYSGTELGCTEGPHMYKHDGYYYILTAEGGTSYGHAVSFARSKTIDGPYEMHPENPILTARNTGSWLQKAGHADLVRVKDNVWAIVYLCGRPVEGKCMLGRESCIQKVTWKDGWPWLEHKGPDPEIPDFGLEEFPVEPFPTLDTFNSHELGGHWNTPRLPLGALIDLRSRPGHLRLHAMPDTIYSVEPTTFVARRVQHHAYSAETLMEYSPEVEFQHAGLVCYYDTTHWYFLNKTFRPGRGIVISLMAYDSTAKRYDIVEEKKLRSPGKALKLAVACDGKSLNFSWGYEDGEMRDIGGPQDALVLSDDYIFGSGWAFTGAFVGLAAWDRFNRKSYADFEHFGYTPGEFDETLIGDIPEVK